MMGGMEPLHNAEGGREVKKIKNHWGRAMLVTINLFVSHISGRKFTKYFLSMLITLVVSALLPEMFMTHSKDGSCLPSRI